MSVSPWNAAAAGEIIVAIIALTVLWIVCLVTVKRRKDRLRLPFLWLKWAIPLFILYVSLSAASEAILIVLEVLDEGRISLLIEILSRLNGIAPFVSSIADVFIQVCLIELALSFLRALGKHGAYHIFIRYSNVVAIVLLVALAIAALVKDEEWLTRSHYGYFDLSWNIVGNLYGAYNIIYWIVSLAVVFLSAFVLFSSIQKKRLRSLARRFFAASFLNLTRSTWEMAFVILYDINRNYLITIPQYTIIVDPVLYTWVTVAIFGLLIAIGFKKRNGLWSHQQQQPQQQQQGFIVNGGGGGLGGGQGLGVPPPEYVLYQQPARAELTSSGSPVWRAELTGVSPTSSNQQYHWPQYQQQWPAGQNQAQNAVFAPTPVEVAAQEYRGVPMDPSYGGGSAGGSWTHQQQPQITQVYEVAGIPDQKA